MQESTARTDIDDESTEKVASPETLSVWGLAWPSILANILYASVGVVALKAVGNLGTDAVAAVGTGGRIFFVIQSIMMAISTGTTALVARAYGARRYQEASQVLYDSILISIFLDISFNSLKIFSPIFFPLCSGSTNKSSKNPIYFPLNGLGIFL